MIADVLEGRRQWHVECTDVLDGLAQLPDNSVHCVVTSPPYFGLRDYGTARWEAGDPDCDHLKVPDPVTAVATSTLDGGKKTTGHQQEGYKSACGRCGAVRVDRQIGLEPTLDAYIERLVAVFREVRRVLRKDGTCWVNMGDSYANDPGNGRGGENCNGGVPHRSATSKLGLGYKRKDLLGVPWRLAFALQADGWYLRSDIVWAKPNPMPESVTDRPTRSHEYVFLLTKSAKYWYDADAIREPASENTHSRGNGTGPKNAGTPFGEGVKHNQDYAAAINGPVTHRNRRTVWTIPTQPRPEAHFATFPDDLVEPCVLAGCPVGGVVLDPFAGRGTTLIVALRHGRRAVGLELNPAYAVLARTQITLDCPMFNGLDGGGAVPPSEIAPTNKQDALGKSTYTGFNARWKAGQEAGG